MGIVAVDTPAKERGHNLKVSLALQTLSKIVDQLYTQHTISQNTLTGFPGTCYHCNIQVYNYLNPFSFLFFFAI